MEHYTMKSSPGKQYACLILASRRQDRNYFLITSSNTVNSWYPEHWYLKLPSHTDEFNLRTFPILIFISTPFIWNDWAWLFKINDTVI